MKPSSDRSCRRGLRWTLGFLLLLVMAGGSAVRADDDPFSEKNRKVDPTADLIDFVATVSPEEAKPGNVITVTITGKPHRGAHTYPVTQRLNDQSELELTTLLYLDTTVFKPLYPIVESDPKPHTYTYKVLDDETHETHLEHGQEFTWKQDFLVQNVPPGKKLVSLAIKLGACNDQKCFYGMRFLNVLVVIDEGPPLATVPADLQARFDKPPTRLVDFIDLGPTSPNPAVPTKDGARVTPKGTQPAPSPKETPPAASPNPTADTDLLTFLGLAVVWGALSLVTPCVFPMIPITVSFFIKQSETKKHSPLLLALIYSGTIAAVLTVAGVFLIQVLQPFSQHYLTNFVLGALFIVFALSLFGMYEIVLPARLVNLTSAQEGRGGIVGTVFMALTFSIISFTCVAPFYGGFIGIASSSQGGAWWSNPGIMLKLGLGALAYSVTFASPFFFLAVFPSLIRELPKSGSWMNTVKVVMGFLELAAALKLLRASELSLMGKADYLTYDVVLGLYIALAIACSLYLLNLYRLPHDYEAPESLSVLRLLGSIAFLALGIYLVPGLFKQGDGERQRPAGVAYNWIEAFLLPDEESGGGTAAGPGSRSTPGTKEVWLGNLEPALQQAEKEQKLVFIDFTGITCANCRINERSVFPRPDIRALFDKYVLVKLFCDTVPPEYQSTTTGAENQRFRDETFKNAQLPLYVIVKPTGGGKFETVGVYPEGKINFPDQFAEFLRKPLQK